MEKIIFIGEYRFPSDYAACNRVLYMAQCAHIAGYEPFVIGKGNMQFKNEIREYKNVKYTSMQHRTISTWEKVLLLFYRHFSYKRSLRQYISQDDVKAIIIYASASARYVPQTIKLCNKMGIKCICDISEWYDKKQFASASRNINYHIFSYMFNHWFEKAKNVICCSDLVYNRFVKKGCQCLKINAILDMDEYTPVMKTENSAVRTLVYFGDAGKKDHLLEIFKAFDQLGQEEKNKISIKVIGMVFLRLKKLFAEFGYDLKSDSGIQIIGRLPKEELIEHIKTADYSILLRPNERYANAGFPSKVAESMALGTPMFCNLTSDLNDYLSEKNAVILDNCSVESIVKALRQQVLCYSNERIDAQRKAAYETAKNCFDISNFVNVFSDFLNE